jgi:hypothetical protein
MDVCMECKNEIKASEKRTRVYRDKSGQLWVHSKCFESYEQTLIGSKAKKQGMILGVCGYCGKPVRERQKYCFEIAGDRKKVLTTYPDYLHLAHQECCKY